MVTFRIVLRDGVVVLNAPLCHKVRGVSLLQECVTGLSNRFLMSPDCKNDKSLVCVFFRSPVQSAKSSDPLHQLLLCILEDSHVDNGRIGIVANIMLRHQQIHQSPRYRSQSGIRMVRVPCRHILSLSVSSHFSLKAISSRERTLMRVTIFSNIASSKSVSIVVFSIYRKKS